MDLLAGFSRMACPCGKSMDFELWWRPDFPATYRVKCTVCGFVGPEHSIRIIPANKQMSNGEQMPDKSK